MSDNVRFHSKHHAKAHHTDATAGYYDSAVNPIASQTEPFKGSFWLSGGNFYTYQNYMSSGDGGSSWVDIETLFGDENVETNSSNWDSTYTTVYTYSADWTSTDDVSDGFSEVFAGDGSNTIFQSNYVVTSGANLLVTIEGVVQTPVHINARNSASTTYHYALSANASRNNKADICFNNAPGSSEYIEVRHFSLKRGNTTNNSYTVGGSALSALLSIHPWTSAGNVGATPNYVYVADTTARVGIGTATPATHLHITGTAASIRLEDNNTAGNPYCDMYQQGGIFRINADNSNQASDSSLRINTGGVDRMTVDDSGNVGIGTTAPGEKLDVAGAIAITGSISVGTTTEPRIAQNAGDLYLQPDTDRGIYLVDHDGSPMMTVKDGGNVGIGTIAPGKALHVVGAIRVNNEHNSGQGLRTEVVGSSAIFGSDSSAIDVRIVTDANNNYGNAEGIIIKDGGNVGIGTTAPNETLTVVGNISAGGTATGQDTNSFVVSGGRVGIGTTIPTQMLDVYKDEGQGDIENGIRISNYTVGNLGAQISDQYSLRLYTARTIGGLPYATIKAPKDTNGWLAFTSGSSDAERLRIAGDGDVGISTDSPGYTLDVDGSIGYEGTINDYSRRILKENITEIGNDEGLIDKFKQIPLYRYHYKPKVDKRELKELVIEEFGEERFDDAFPKGCGESLMWDCPDAEMKTFIDEKASQLRAERRTDYHQKQNLNLGLIADDPILEELFPEIVSYREFKDEERDDEVWGIKPTAYIGMLHGTIKELVSKVESLETRIEQLES